MTSIDLRPLPLPDEIRAGTVPEVFARVVMATPQAAAVRDQHGRVWSYAELRHAVDAFAASLTDATSGGERHVPRIGLHLPHGVPMIVGQLGALSAGYCYVPLDPTYPAERLRLMTRIAELDAVVTSPDDRTEWDVPRVPFAEPQPWRPAEPTTRLEAVPTDPERPAYILFTSGSTGRPKGVLHTHRSMLHGIANHVRNMQITSRDRLTVLTSFSFDMAVSDLYAALLSGATAVPLDVRTQGVPALVTGLHESGATIFHATPTVFRLLVAQDRPIRTIRLALLGGEPVHGEDVAAARRTFAPDCVFVNGYGFTEASFVVQQQIRPTDAVDQGAVLPIGRALPGYDVSIEDVDDDGAGDLVVRSAVLARGYVGDPTETRARFSSDLGTYRPGDRVRRLPDGRLAFAGRADGQVKVNGVRVELAEIQVLLERQPDVARAVVVAEHEGGTRVVAHVQVAPGAAVTEVDLRGRLRRLLPDAMIPSRCHVTDALPLTPSGKVDVRRLSRHAIAGRTTRVENAREQVVLDAWTAAVGSDPGGLDVPFFDAGGGSLAIARLHQSLRSQVAETPSLPELLGAGTVREMARLLQPRSSSSADAARVRAAARAARRQSRTGSPR